MSLVDETGEHLVADVAPMSTNAIEASALDAINVFAPGVAGRAVPLNVEHLVDYALPQQDIHFVPVSDDELPEMWAFAQCDGAAGDEIEVLVKKTEWDNLFEGGRRSHHARGTFMHELGHAILHVNAIRRRRAMGLGLPRQIRPRELKPYKNAEWQAWCFAGCMLAPRASIVAAGTLSVSALSDIFMTSTQLLALHLKRLGLVGRR
jgi:hypothetical protein